MTIGLMFAGQGAQAPGMGRDLFDGCAAARRVFDEADAALGRPITDLCFEGSAADLTASANCQPAIYVMAMACAAALQERCAPEVIVTGGLSLGEWGACTAAGALDFAAGVPLVARRGELMDAACQATKGGMAAVIGADETLVAGICEDCGIDVANYNCPGQIVISGDCEGVARAVEALGDAGVKRVVSLQVAGAYHSRLMAPAAEAFEAVLAAAPLAAPRCPIAQNAVGELVDDPEAVRRNLAAQVTGSVRWEQCVRAMIAVGVDALVEVGPGKVLTGFMRRIDRRFPVFNVGTLADLERTAEGLAAL